ncbi:Elongation factor P (EF-P) [Mycobacteroides abscessus subsp. abscessus]|uniref:Elongation factor P n=8 Tax=Mycobacteroides abscessus TaxID=36809 RepID=EFP_MYCA9|nr:elongation factor P [Mycobacteroides abscessus]B1MCE5.1 RecName: Full=Elongation factor P; Short=EF-P [Mycobacteroides abscessus ATCC 19977]ETZ89860.1 translation elongation factor P [Mycobacteroides abscessus MAB_030201_1075]ETZ94246.1 translation elongation factor P [Mycobacteroides abscessus MAB_030201_1061]EUA49420.1 translation elongation factor P [Mycobacteroides abscessus 21]EUA61433.1 translation elongation factor P [Mycobacteroides abscessus 1948]AEI54833.1 elongation factor P [My
MASTADFKNGLVLNIDGQLWQITEFQHVKPGKGPAFVRTKLKNVLSGKVVDKTFNAGVKVETATVDRRDTTYLYRDGDSFVFMDSQDYEQHHLSPELVGDAHRFLLEGMTVQVAFNEGAALYIELPVSVELEVTHTEPGLQGDRSSAGTKPATVETGAEIQVPLFINTGDRLKVDTRDASYLGRVNG